MKKPSKKTEFPMPSPAVTVAFALPMTQAELSERLDAALAVAAEKAVKDLLADESVITLEQAAAMTPWTESGFKRVASKNNLAFIKGLHKSAPSYRRGDVVKMLRDLRVWPNGKPTEVAA